MHPNPNFRKTPENKNIEFIRERSFGILAVNAQPAPLISHIPFQLSKDGKYLEAHLARANPILKLLTQPRQSTIAVSGGDAYISPDWYGIVNQVPTWNYIAAHIQGTLKRLEDNALHGILERLSENMENRLMPKTPWKIEKLTDEIYAGLKKAIVPIAMDVDNIESTWKLSQNKPSNARDGVIDALTTSGIGLQTNDILNSMKDLVQK